MLRLLALERRVARGDLVEATEIAAAAASILARSPVKRLFDVSDVGQGRFVYDYDHDALAYDEALAGHYVLATSLTREVADATQVLAHYRSLQYVEKRFRVLKSALGLGPIRHWTETRVRGHVALCVLAAVIEQLIGNRLRDADVRDPDIDTQYLTAECALQELTNPDPAGHLQRRRAQHHCCSAPQRTSDPDPHRARSRHPRLDTADHHHLTGPALSLHHNILWCRDKPVPAPPPDLGKRHCRVKLGAGGPQHDAAARRPCGRCTGPIARKASRRSTQLATNPGLVCGPCPTRCTPHSNSSDDPEPDRMGTTLTRLNAASQAPRRHRPGLAMIPPYGTCCSALRRATSPKQARPRPKPRARIPSATVATTGHDSRTLPTSRGSTRSTPPQHRAPVTP